MKKRNLIFILFFLTVLFFLYSFLNKPKITVIVRSVGEHSEKKCIENLNNIFGENNVYLIKNVTPLFNATKKSIKTAQKRRSEWTLFVDADTFVDKDNIWVFIDKATEIASNDAKAFVFQGLLFDKFPGEYRQSGVWLYKTSKLKLAKKYYNICADKLKPDDCLASSIVENGGHSYGIEYVIGIHDFFQSPQSIVKKYVLRAAKYPYKTALWAKNWNKLAKEDEDFYWALKGIELYNSLDDKNIINDANWFNGLLEKFDYKFPPIHEVTDVQIDNALKKYVKPASKKLDNVEFYQSRLEKRNLI